MAWGSGNTGAGSGLGLNIVSSKSRPSSPREGMIWVNTSVKITTWALASDAPKAPAPGALWILSGTRSAAAYNISRKNVLMVYPLRAFQWDGGSWVPREAQSYIDGGWKAWLVLEYLYNRGKDITAITGGWSLAKTQSNSKPTFDLERDSMVLSTQYIAGRQFGGGKIYTNRKISFSGYSSVTAVYDLEYLPGGKEQKTSMVAGGVSESLTAGKSQLTSIPLSGKNSSQVEFIHSDSTSATLRIREIYLTEE